MLKVVVTYPKKEEEQMIMRQNMAFDSPKSESGHLQEALVTARRPVRDV
jgi:MoxR-like ATPase